MDVNDRDKEILDPTITVYTSRMCPICTMVKDFLDTSDMTFQEVHVDINPWERMKLIGKTGKITVPQTNINGTWISGFDPVKMMQAWNDPPE